MSKSKYSIVKQDPWAGAPPGTWHREARVKQSLDEATPVMKDPRVSAMGVGVTVGQFIKMAKRLKIPSNAKIKFVVGQPPPGWALLESVSFSRSENEVSLW